MALQINIYGYVDMSKAQKSPLSMSSVKLGQRRDGSAIYQFTLFLCLEAELAAGGVNVVTLFAAERHGNAGAAENFSEAFLARD